MGKYIVSILFGMVGFVFFRYGKKMGKSVLWMTGLALMGFPYIVTDPILQIIIGIIILTLGILFKDKF